MQKLYDDYKDVIKGIQDDSTIMVGGFGLCGIPENSIRALVESNVKNLTVISNNCGIDDFGLGLLLQNKQIKKIIGSYVGENKEFERQVIEGTLEVELTPQGTLAEKIRAGGAGIPAFFTPAGVGTQIADGKEMREFNGREYILEKALTADFSFVRAHRGDKIGNLIYNKTAQNFNPIIATAGKVTVAEVEEVVENGELNPNFVHTPSIYTQRVIQGNQEKRIEKRTVALSSS